MVAIPLHYLCPAYNVGILAQVHGSPAVHTLYVLSGCLAVWPFTWLESLFAAVVDSLSVKDLILSSSRVCAN